jgi:hypothetical protein
MSSINFINLKNLKVRGTQKMDTHIHRQNGENTSSPYLNKDRRLKRRK